MFRDNKGGKINRRTILRRVDLMGRIALLGLLLTACGGTAAEATSTAVPQAAATTAPAAAATDTTAPAAAATNTTAPAAAATDTTAPAAGGSDQVVNMLWTDTDNLRQPRIAEFTKA